MAQGVTNQHVDPNYWFTGVQSRVPVVSASKTVPGPAATSDNQPFCGTCHKAHGSTHRAALIWDDPTSPALEDGTSATQTCQACHYK
jgi:predicted CXXCH cytochrome family protein